MINLRCVLRYQPEKGLHRRYLTSYGFARLLFGRLALRSRHFEEPNNSAPCDEGADIPIGIGRRRQRFATLNRYFHYIAVRCFFGLPIDDWPCRDISDACELRRRRFQMLSTSNSPHLAIIDFERKIWLMYICWERLSLPSSGEPDIFDLSDASFLPHWGFLSFAFVQMLWYWYTAFRAVWHIFDGYI